MKLIVLFFFLFSLIITVQAQIHTAYVEYKDGDQILEGFVAYKDAIKAKVPAVVVVHEWTGINPYTIMRCQKLAEMGYVAFAADIYGKGIRPQTPQEAGKQATIYRGNRTLMRHRVQLAIDQVRKMEQVDPANVAAIGYCFGGGCVLELARSGADVKGVVSFHGNLDTPTPDDIKNFKGKILVCHGGDDPFVPMESVSAFITEMKNAKAQYELVIYSGAVHSFTNPDAGDDNSKGAAYNRNADLRSWASMADFLNGIFK